MGVKENFKHTHNTVVPSTANLKRDPQVIVVGSYVQDHAWTTTQFPAVGESRIGIFSTGPGGKGFNQAIACHRQDVSTLFIGAIGADHLGQNAQSFSEQEGLSCLWEVYPEVSTAASTITINSKGENLIVVALAANAALSTEFLQKHYSSFSYARVILTQLECNLEATRTALSYGRSVGAINILSPAPINENLSTDLLELADIITPNETEFAFLLRHLFATELPENYWECDDENLHSFCRLTAIPTVIITLGDKGCFVSHDSENLHGDNKAYYRISAELVTTVDTTGAGDAFSGGLAAGLIHFSNQAFSHAVRHANRVAALSTEISGTAPAMPTIEKVAARFCND